uniref:Uncharacterized protein n=1 Tax=Romanomermis culicivorax TaxID=13658 RepID=A0A915HRQ7_ROMCU
MTGSKAPNSKLLNKRKYIVVVFPAPLCPRNDIVNLGSDDFTFPSWKVTAPKNWLKSIKHVASCSVVRSSSINRMRFVRKH